MKSIAMTLVAAASAGLGGCVHPAGTVEERGEIELGRMIEGRVPGKPQGCISVHSNSRVRVIDRTAVVYDAGDTVWVARPRDPRSLDRSDILVVERIGSQLCKQDVVRTVDRQGGFPTGLVFLDNFVPYRRPDR